MGSLVPTRVGAGLILLASLLLAVELAVPTVAGSSQREALPIALDGPSHDLRSGFATHPAQRRPIAHASRGRKPAPFFEGCMIGVRRTRSNRCLYGNPHGRFALFLFGDSHALQHFPALQVIAKRHRWRLVVLTKADCTPGRVKIRSMKRGGEYWQCDAWRRHTLRRIEKVKLSGIVAMSSHTVYRAHRPSGKLLDGAKNAAAMEVGYAATLRRLRRAGLATIVIRDTPEASFNVPDCVAAHTGNPGACAFSKPHDRDRDFDVRAARKVAGTGLINLDKTICPHDLCRAVVNRILVYRDNAHLNATYARTLVRDFEPTLGRAARRSRRGICPRRLGGC